jgi:predicted naringenin-chalcone synthase
MQKAYCLDAIEARKLAFMYNHSGIDYRYSVLEDFGKEEGGQAFSINANTQHEVGLEQRMNLYQQHALPLSLGAVDNCISGKINASHVTHLITVSCTGLSAPGLDLEIAEALDLPTTVFRTSVNFMGCYAAIHALRLAKMICDSTPNSNVLIVSTELCTIHFQTAYSQDNAASSLLFADGSAAVLVSNCNESESSISLKSFFSQVSFKGKKDMAWQLSSKGFLMTLSSYIPELIQEDISSFVATALDHGHLSKDDITHWCIHPGGRRILDVIQKQLGLSEMDLSCSRKVLSTYGNLSSPSILFVLKEILENRDPNKKANVFGVAFGPGLTMETFIATERCTEAQAQRHRGKGT